MGGDCSCLNRKDPKEEPLKESFTEQYKKRHLSELKLSETAETQECTPRAFDFEVIGLQKSIRSYLVRKRQRTRIEGVIFLEDLAIESEVEPQIGIEAPENPYDLLSEKVKRRLEILGPYVYRLTVVGGELLKPVVLTDGNVYWGQWKGKKRFGKGKLFTVDGGLLEGYWDGVLHLDGRVILPNGEYYEGGFFQGRKQGFGRFEDESGTIYYDGEWRGDKRQGHGIERTPESTYEGTFEDDQKNGSGLIKWSDGEVYEGEFYQNFIHGRGKYTWSPTKWYTGEWEFNKMHGTGHFYCDGNEYEGDFVQDKKHGKGVYRWGGNTYDGDWRDGKMHGMGRLTMSGKRTGLYYFENNRRIGPKIRDRTFEPMRATY